MKKKVFILLSSWVRRLMQKGYKKLLRSRSMSSIDKIPMQDEYENAQEGDMDLDRKSQN